MADYEFSADVDLVIATKLRGETYFGEACIRCGKIIKRESEG